MLLRRHWETRGMPWLLKKEGVDGTAAEREDGVGAALGVSDPEV